MNYILGRDLPFAKKGGEIYVEENELRVYNGDGKKVFIGHADILFLEQYEQQGWIRRVQPREWWVNMHEGSGNNYFCNSKDEAIRTMWGRPEHNHIVKVREVIE